MKLGRFITQGADGPVQRICLVLPEQERVIDLRAAEVLRQQARGATPEAALRYAALLFPESMKEAIALGDQFLETAAEAAQRYGDDASLPFAGLQWGPACDPGIIRDGLTFVQHLKRFSELFNMPVHEAFLQVPGYYKGTPWTVIAHEAEVPWPPRVEQMDYELELGWVIGRRAHNVTPETARKHLFGVTIFNDFSSRDFQKLDGGIGMGPMKCKDFSYGIGPWITTLDEFPHLDRIRMAVRVNGETRGEGDTSEMLWTVEELISWVSLNDYAQPGDVIGSGTMGDGCGFEQGRFLSPGDVVELEVEGIGVLRNRLGQPQSGGWWPTPRKPFL
jgi:2-keto-4-pentenoate hydratase/2-oxohepta-3-ene-1,7-dioic acid hydratase in catechol pathway